MSLKTFGQANTLLKLQLFFIFWIPRFDNPNFVYATLPDRVIREDRLMKGYISLKQMYLLYSKTWKVLKENNQYLFSYTLLYFMKFQQELFNSNK